MTPKKVDKYEAAAVVILVFWMALYFVLAFSVWAALS